MRLTRLSAAMLAAGLLLPSAARAQTLTINNTTALKVYVHFFAASDLLLMLPCGQVAMEPQSMQGVSRDASPDCKRHDLLTLRANFTEYWGGYEGNCSLTQVPWAGVLTIRGTQERLDCS